MPKRIKILIADKIILPDKVFCLKNNLVVIKKYNHSNEEILKYINENNIKILIIRSIREINKDFLARCNLKIIATASKGINHIDADYAKKLNISIINSESGNTDAAAEHTIGMIISIMKNFCYSDKLIRSGKFSDYDFRRNSLEGKKIGVIGFGKVGSRIGELANAFRMEVMANDINGGVIKRNKKFKFYPLENILKNCDIITLHIPLNKYNFQFINKNKLDLLKKNVIFINTSRGEVMDEDDFFEFMERNPSVYAGIDVFCKEPEIRMEWKSLKNVLMTNHIAGKTEESAIKISGEIWKMLLLEINKYILNRQNLHLI